jgi:oligopeptide transport system permease protein
MKKIKDLPYPFYIFFTLLSLCFFITFEKAIFCDLEAQNLYPSQFHLFGTDDLGRDIFYRTFYALKISLIIGLLATIIDMIFGALFGILSALLKPPYANLAARFLDIMTILPQMLLSILILMIVKNSFFSLIIAISCTGWIPTARAMRSEMLKLKNKEFITSLKCLGFSNTHILFKHLIPSCLPTLLVSSALCLPSAIFSEAFMSFLGLGISPPSPSLGNMIADGLPALNYYPWRLLAPATCVFALIFFLNVCIDKLKKKLGEVL